MIICDRHSQRGYDVSQAHSPRSDRPIISDPGQRHGMADRLGWTTVAAKSSKGLRKKRALSPSVSDDEAVPDLERTHWFGAPEAEPKPAPWLAV